jgi:hypothetical protein
MLTLFPDYCVLHNDSGVFTTGIPQYALPQPFCCYAAAA